MQPKGPSVCGQKCFKPPSLGMRAHPDVEFLMVTMASWGTCQIPYHNVVFHHLGYTLED